MPDLPRGSVTVVTASSCRQNGNELRLVLVFLLRFAALCLLPERFVLGVRSVGIERAGHGSLVLHLVSPMVFSYVGVELTLDPRVTL